MHLTAQRYAELMPDGAHLQSDEPEMESSLQWSQLALLVDCLEWHWRDREDFFIGANLTVWYSREQLRKREFRGPDFFLLRDTERRPRASWVVWEERGRYPDLIIELLSNSTEQVDRTTKKHLYKAHFRTPEYFWFHPETLELAGFRLDNGVYRPILGEDRDWRYSEQLGLYLGVHAGQLRYFDRDGTLIATPGESALAAADRAAAMAEQALAADARATAMAEQAPAADARADAADAQARAVAAALEQERQRAATLEARLLALGGVP